MIFHKAIPRRTFLRGLGTTLPLPVPSKFSSAKPSGSMTLWQLAQTGLAR